MDLCKSTSLLGANHTPKVSVIVPVYKVEKYLQECIESVLAQTFTDFELILVDDGSPDNSGKICDDYDTRDSLILCHPHLLLGKKTSRKLRFCLMPFRYPILKNFYFDVLLRWCICIRRFLGTLKCQFFL